MGLPGSRGHEAVDAHTFAAWGVDFLKYDNCFSPDDEPPRGAYEAMRDALNATGRPVLFSVCDWGAGDVWEWGAGVGNAWRTTPDVAPTWASILANAQATAGLARFAGPGGWNDPDMLEVGNAPLSLLPRAWTAQFALWCVLKAPLLVGADLTRLHADALRLLTNADLIAWNQDPLGVAGDRVWQAGPYSAWVAPLADGGRAVALLCTRPPDVQARRRVGVRLGGSGPGRGCGGGGRRWGGTPGPAPQLPTQSRPTPSSQPHASNATIPWAALGLAPGDGGARALRVRLFGDDEAFVLAAFEAGVGVAHVVGIVGDRRHYGDPGRAAATAQHIGIGPGRDGRDHRAVGYQRPRPRTRRMISSRMMAPSVA